MNNFHFSGVTRLRMAGLKPQLIGLLELMLRETPIDFGVAWMGGIRTNEQQYELFKKGASKADGFKNKSAHQSGLAVDLLPYINGKVDISERNYDILREVFEKCAKDLNLKTKPLISWDMNHFEIYG